jgi:hypothetical protein
MKENHGWGGYVRVIHRDLEGAITAVRTFENEIHNAAMQAMAEVLLGDVTDLQIKYLGTGTSSGAVDTTDETLHAELFRKQITAYSTGSTGECNTTVYIGPAESTGTIHELAWFAGADATTCTDSGIMVARVLYDHLKTNLESLQIDRTDTISS